MDSTIRADSSVEASQNSDADYQSPLRADNLALSSIGSSFFTEDDYISLNSSIISPNVFVGIENMTPDSCNSGGNEGSTIVSSNPSASVPPPPEANRDIFMMSPHPQFTTVGVNSMSTMNTEVYPSDQVFRETTFGDRNYDDEDSLSVASSQSTSVSAILSGSQPVRGSFEDGAFERVASHLAFDSSNDSSAKNWHDRLISDSDWDRFRATSKDLLPFISEDSESVSQCPLPLPPRPTGRVSGRVSPNESLRAMYKAGDHLPSEFICGICKDVLVGACILDCNCSSSTVCITCWEDGDRNQQDFAKRMDFVWVEESKKCPSCHSNSETKVYCNALDVAILRIIQDLPDSDSSVAGLKQMYYHRLSVWRRTVRDRNERLRKENSIRDDELLSKLIQEEERVFWNQRRPQSQTKRLFGIPSKKFMVISKTFFALVAIAGLKHVSKR